MPKRIAVVGGGLSGLANAFYLKRYNERAEIRLFESGPRLGGVIGTETVDVPDVGRFVIDQGADMFATEPPAAVELCRELGVENELIVPDTSRAGAMIVRKGQLMPIPDGFVLMRATKLWQMVATPILSLRGKMRFLAERFVPPTPGLDADQDDISVAQFVRHRMGNEILDRLVGPLVAGIYTADVERLSMKATMGPMVSMMQAHGSLARATLKRRRAKQDSTERSSAGARYEKFRGFPRGMVQLIETLADNLGDERISKNTAIDSLRYQANGTKRWAIRSNSSWDEFDEVVLATPPAVSARLIGGVDEALFSQDCQRAATELSSIECASAAIVVLCVRKSQVKSLPNRFGFVVPALEDRDILAVSFASHKYPIRCPEDHTIIRAFVGGATRAELLANSDSQLVEIVQRELSGLIDLSGTPTLTRVVRWNDAMPQYHVGHLNRVATIERAVDRIPGLRLATNALRGVGIAPVIAAAKRNAS